MMPEFKNRTLGRSFADAANGIIHCLKNERNMRIDFVAAVYVLAFSFFLPLTKAEYACLFLSIGAVITAESFNTSIENICDFNERRINIYIKTIKDISAGAVLICGLFAFSVGAVIFIRTDTLDLLKAILDNPLLFTGLSASIVLSVIFIFAGPSKIARFFTKKR